MTPLAVIPLPFRTNDVGQIHQAMVRDAHYSVLSGETDFDNSHATRMFASAIPLSDPIESTSMPESWVRAILIIRANTLLYPNSGIRLVILEKLVQLINFDVIPRIPIRGSKQPLPQHASSFNTPRVNRNMCSIMLLCRLFQTSLQACSS